MENINDSHGMPNPLKGIENDSRNIFKCFLPLSLSLSFSRIINKVERNFEKFHARRVHKYINFY